MLSTFGFGKKTPPQQESTQSESANRFAPLHSDDPNDEDEFYSDDEDPMNITTTNPDSQDEEDKAEEVDGVNIYDPPDEEPTEPQAAARHESEPTPRLLEKDLAKAQDKNSDDSSDDEDDDIAVMEVRPSQNKPKVSFGANSVKEIPPSGKKRASRGTPAANKATKLTKTSRPTARPSNNQTNTPTQRNILNPYRTTPRTRFVTPPHKTRITVKYAISKDMLSLDHIHDMVCETLKELQAIDSKTIIYSWWDNPECKPLLTPNDIPRNLWKMKQYVDRLYIPKEADFKDGMLERQVWAAVYLGHQVEVKEFFENSHRWQHTLLPRTLQCPKTATAGWGLYSTINMDTYHLEDVISKRFNLNFSIRYRPITEEKWTDTPYTERTKALHFECDARTQDKAVKVLHKIYGMNKHSSKGFPAGYRMRIIPDFNQATAIQQPRRTKGRE
jgi:hypothetical protein